MKRVRQVELFGVMCACAAVLTLSASAGATAASGPPTPVPPPLVFGHASPPAPRAAPQLSQVPAGLLNDWKPLTNPAPSGFYPGSMLLEPNGTVLVYEDNTGTWMRLTPSATGSYIAGTWSTVPSMPSGYEPLYFGSAILPTGVGQPAGSLIAEGDEYNGSGTAVWGTKGALYNAKTNTWKSVSPPSGWKYIGDAESTVLANGKYMLSSCCDSTPDQALLTPSTLTWLATGTGKEYSNDEAGWTLLPNGDLQAIDVVGGENASDDSTVELYNPSTGKWTNAGFTPNDVVDLTPESDGPVYEIGPQVMLPDDNIFVIGATGNTAVFHYNSVDTNDGTWSTGPAIPNINGSPGKDDDGQAAPLPNGDVLFNASTENYGTPMELFLYNGKTITQVADPDSYTPDLPSFVSRMLVLPNGQIMYDDGEGPVEIWTGDTTATSAYLPTITSLSSATLTPGDTYTLKGTQLAGRSQGAQYGDDFQDDTNYPLVRLTSTTTADVYYAPTSAENTLSIAPGVAGSTKFTVPSGTPAGKYNLVVIGDGVASAKQAVTVS